VALIMDKPLTVDQWLDQAQYLDDEHYVPSQFAVEFITFIKLVNDGKGEENTSPVIHYKMLDQLCSKDEDVANLCSRGLAKSAVFGEYLTLYLAVFGEIPDFGVVDYMLYISDSIENGVKKMRKRIERRVETSKFLNEYVPEYRFTDLRWYFKNKQGKEFVVTGHGVSTGVRGTVELNTRPQLAVIDDVVSDSDARSPTLIAAIEDIVYSAIDYALHPQRRKIIWSGTPFSAKDPLYKAIESGVWKVNVFPICEEFPCEEKDFRGAWEERFTYKYVLKQYNKAKGQGKLHSFNQELMLRISSEEERVISDSDIIWYNRNNVLQNKGQYNFYITTDFATTENNSGDYSVISVWAFNANGDWLWVDGVVKKQLMDANVDDLFRLAQIYRPQQVGVEVSGQQGGFIPWIRNEMMSRNIWFTLASENNKGKEGIRPVTNKMQRFNVVVPWFKAKKVWFPEDMKDSPEVVEMVNELSLVVLNGFKSRHDDCIDTVSMLSALTPWKPSEYSASPDAGNGDYMWEEDDKDEVGAMASYIV